MKLTSRLLQGASVLLVFATYTCAAFISKSTNSVWWTPKLYVLSLDEVDSALSKPVLTNGKPASVVLVNGANQKTVKTCSQYLDAIRQGMNYPYPNGMDFPFVERCYALMYLRSAQDSSKSFLASQWTEDVLDRLPPFRVGVESDLEAKADAARKRGESWKQFDPTMKVMERSAHHVMFQNETDRWSLDIVAQGDFNHDGYEDQVVIACDSGVTHGSGFCFPMVLTAYAPEKVMTLISAPAPPYNLASSNEHQ
jgi:hypothetical protein